ncbi:RNA polymerase sigma-70 factor [Stigmatella sp. ncwal1]|uniref:RNA polymerase sigma-70 factor n=1 Tax=Stigmatella ashevillensis TaxID=2995309 RepID=A0ABT5DGH4_9BACT|nr:RNA polymerase sigma-70 factor [Stigmatella ashevillena]MDC0712769.1 RNA polymerase sigma-70 factor [Stigmatella ashevillena]
MTDVQVEDFEAHRPSLWAIAYRMLGSASEAEDVVQETWLRWQSASRDGVRSGRAFLSAVATRLCLDHLKSARARREVYVGPWLPEPVRTDTQVDPETISFAFLVLLESLTPMERAVYLLNEVFGYSHAEVAQMLDKEEAACRQLLHRARGHLVSRRPRFAPSKEAHARMVTSFLSACSSGDLEGIKRLLSEDVTAWADGGGKVSAATRLVQGTEAVARQYLGLLNKMMKVPGSALETSEVNGWPALVVRLNGAVFDVISFETDGEHIHAIHAVLNPDKLARL